MRRIINILTNNRVLIGVLLIGVFLRFYRLEGFVTFLGDQGRDAIIIKRILTGEHFPAIGPPTSIGQVYLGPFYYYFIAPWLLLSNFNPIGLAVGVAFFSSLYLLINYLIVKELFDKKIALISTVFLSFSSVLIDFSRFSWNPNLLPLSTLLTIYFVLKSLKTNKWHYFALSGIFLSFTIQLHYLALFLIPPIGVLYLLSLTAPAKQSFKQLMSQSTNLFICLFFFIFFTTPLIIFDLRHNFLNSKLFLALFKSSGTSFSTKINSFFDSFYFLNLYSFNISLNKFFVYLLFLFLFIIQFTLIKKRSKGSFVNNILCYLRLRPFVARSEHNIECPNLKIFLFIFILTILGMSLYDGPKYPHYFGILFPLYYIIISYFIVFPQQYFWEKYLTIIFVIGFIFLNFQKYPYFTNHNNNQIILATNIAQKIANNVTKKKFTVTALPEKYSDSTYRYFLEIWGKRAIEKDSLDKADELFVVCEKKCTPIIGNPQWDIAYFAPNKIVGQWTVEGVKIYKLVR